MNKVNELILYEDRDVIVCYKEAGVAVQTKRPSEQDLESLLKNYRKVQGEEPYIGVIHRLDQPVEGIMVFAKTKTAAAALNRQMKEEVWGKYYLAVLCGHLRNKSGELVDYLLKDGKTNTSSVVKKETAGAKKSVLFYEVIEESEKESLVKIKLQTGRHHQIRVQMAHQECPLTGDYKYGRSKGQLSLCAYAVCFRHPATGNLMSFEILPKNMQFSRFSNLESAVK